ncbi:probable G-protein coupled receptor 19 [Electrophorus electricus]|uniref:probable G-protein coupled receptor 19 n=1 Tax=Electrophorus electricus TaxID=8005 RepID=UPI0015D06A84|nr:probable G-protein coupled receptor 19 [Electrophorus electricus]
MTGQTWTEAAIRALMCLMGIFGNNWLLCCSLPTSRSEVRTNDILFVNLALSNLITNYLVDLPETLDFTRQWPMGRTYCGTFNFCSDLSESCSIFATMFITVYWHQKLVGSLKHGGAPVRMDNTYLVAALLAGSWTGAVVFSLPHFFFASKNVWNESCDRCTEQYPSPGAEQTYEMLYLVLANVVPIIGIVCGSVQIAVTLLQNHKRIETITTEVTRRADVSVAEDHARSAGGNATISGNEAQKFASEVSPGNVPEHQRSVIKSKDKSRLSTDAQMRAVKSVLAVATVFLFFWLTHLVLSVISIVFKCSVIDEIISYVGAGYTCIIPYIYLHGVKKLKFSCRA